MIKKNYRTKKSKKRFSKKSKKNMKGGTENNEINKISVRELLKNINIEIINLNKKLLDKFVTYKIKKEKIIPKLFYEISKFDFEIYNEIKKELRKVSIDKNANGDITTTLGSPLDIFERNVLLEPTNYNNAMHPGSTLF